MAGLLSGLEKFGLSGLDKVDLFEEQSKKKEEDKKKVKTPEEIEKEVVFDKTIECPVCGEKFKSKTVKSGKVRVTGSDIDMRPQYEVVDLLKYDVIMCSHCGYTALTRYFKYVTDKQSRLVKDNISQIFRATNDDEPIVSYEEALNRHKLALANAIVKKSSASEKAYICLKTGWILRGMVEASKARGEDESIWQEYEEAENEFLKNAMDGFVTARQNEGFPMCGMDETMVDYLIAILAMRFERYDVASKLIGNILVSQTANPRMKERSREAKDMLLQKIKEQKAST